jgi:hypothetical protein
MNTEHELSDASLEEMIDQCFLLMQSIDNKNNYMYNIKISSCKDCKTVELSVKSKSPSMFVRSLEEYAPTYEECFMQLRSRLYTKLRKEVDRLSEVIDQVQNISKVGVGGT